MANAVKYGLVNVRDVADQLITDIGVATVETMITQTTAQHEQEIAAAFEHFVRPTTDFRLIYRTLGTARSQPLDSTGRALPIKGGASYQVEWPLQWSGNAWGRDYVANLRMTVRQAAEQNELMLDGDRQWMKDHVLAGLFYNGAGWTWNDETRNDGALTILGLANGDAQVYPRTGSAPAATAQHYLFQAAGIADATNPYPTIYSTLKSYPGNTGQIVALIPSNLVATTRALAGFLTAADPNVQQPQTASVLVGTLAGNWPGRLIGYVNGVWIREWSSLPSGYIIAVDDGAEPALAMRQDPLTALQGFKLAGTREDFPYTEFQYRRLAGFGAWNRVGALIMQIGAGAYSIPTNFTSPMG